MFVSLKAEYASCVNKLEKDLVANYKSQFENLFKAEAPTWETHGNLMVRTGTTNHGVVETTCIDYMIHNNDT